MLRAVGGAKEIAVELVGSIYEAALEPCRWRPVLQRLTKHFDSGVGVLWTHDFSDDTVVLESPDPWCIVGADEASVNSFVSYYSSRNVWAPNARHLPEGQTTVSSALYPDNLLPRTEFYCDWLRPLDLQFGIGSAVIKEETRDVKLSFLRSGKVGPFAPAEQQQLRSLLPHVRIALELHRKLQKSQLLATAACAALDRLTFGVVLVSRDGSVLHANRAAQELASSSGAFSFKAGSLHCAVSSSDVKLRLMLKGAALTGAGVGACTGGALKLRGERGIAHVVVAPMWMAQAPFGAPVAAVVFCSDSDQSTRSLSGALRTLHGLTAAEAKLADAVLAGMSLQEYAEARNLSINTVRCQLKAIGQKTGVRRQVDLVRVLLNSVPPITPEGLTSSQESVPLDDRKRPA